VSDEILLYQDGYYGHSCMMMTFSLVAPDLTVSFCSMACSPRRDEEDKQLVGAGLGSNVAGVGANVGLGAGRRPADYEG